MNPSCGTATRRSLPTAGVIETSPSSLFKNEGSRAGESRRSFLKKTVVATAAITGGDLSLLQGQSSSNEPGLTAPWYRRAFRWGQTNITEHDPTHYDIAWWRDYWKRTQVQGVIINAGGIVAYYPSKFPLHRRAQFLGERDLFGELVAAAHQDGLTVLARMDSSGAHAEFYAAHPDWFTVDDEGKPYRAGELYVSCINGPYYHEYLPEILHEIADRYHPEGFTDNSWSGLGRGSICYCENCVRQFHDQAGQALPPAKDWEDKAYRAWLQWSYARRLEIWDLNNRITREAGGPHCLWVGMNSGSVTGQCQSFRDYKEICARAEIILLDHQARSDASGFQNNGETGKLVHGLLGWGKLLPESMALYQAGLSTFRLSAKPEPEARLWILEGFAGGIQPWWHHVGAYQEDRRAFRTIEPINRWHQANQQYLIDRQPVASVGVVWSQQNTDYYGRDDAEVRVEQPWRGITQALIRSRIPYLPIHADQIGLHAQNLAVLILPNLTAMSDAQVSSLRQFVEHGGGLVATGETSLANEWGDTREDFALADLFGAHIVEKHSVTDDLARNKSARETEHTYLRLAPASAAPGSQRHSVLGDFADTDILPFGGMLRPLRVDAGAQVLLTFIPPFPIYPPETAWMRQPHSDIPGLILNENERQGRVAFLPADLDRRFARDNFPDHAHLLSNLVKWAARDRIPLVVQGPGLVDCHLYHQPGRLILHLINLTNANTWRAPVNELIPVGPLQVRVKLPTDVRGRTMKLLVSAQKKSATLKEDWATFEIKSLLDHEVIVLGQN